MDGLLIDSEPLWNEAAEEVFAYCDKQLTPEEYATTTGLRTNEFVAWWLRDYKFDETELEQAGTRVIKLVNEKVIAKSKMKPGVPHIINFFYERKFRVYSKFILISVA